jgi:hypothetical protein
MNKELELSLQKFCKDNRFKGKGPLSVALVVTRHARELGLPLNSERLKTSSRGQVLGLGKSAVQKILAEYGEFRILAAEAGRTSRGSLDKMEIYVSFLNNYAQPEDLVEIEEFWVERVRDFFAGKPFVFSLDASRGLKANIRYLVSQAVKRQKEVATGTQYAGALLQHLVGSKLECALGPGKFEHNSFSTSDAQTGRAGDFLIGDVAIHVTTAPGEAVIERCRSNINNGLRPIIITVAAKIAAAQGLADNAELGERIDIFDIEQFVALNLYELGKFCANERRTAVEDIINTYNKIVGEYETDPSLKIEFR